MDNNFALVKSRITSPNIMAMVKERLGEKSGPFITSVLDLLRHNEDIAKCDPVKLLAEAMKSASLDLPLGGGLGFAYIVPYKDKGTPIPQFQIGYKGIIQLAMRSGQFVTMNTAVIHEGYYVEVDLITGKISISGKKESDVPIGYLFYFKLINGFEKVIFMTKEQVVAHAKRHSKNYGNKGSTWTTNFDAMAKKTVILQGKTWLPMSVEMRRAFELDSETIENDYPQIPEHTTPNAPDNSPIDIRPDVKEVKIEEPGQEEPDF